jgi:hypothetical protein
MFTAHSLVTASLGALLELERRALDLHTLDLDRPQDVLDGGCLVRGRLAGDQRLGRVGTFLLVLGRVVTVKGFELLLIRPR